MLPKTGENMKRMTQTGPCAVTSRLLQAKGFVHGFFTRHGGCSEGPYASLNTSFSVGDERERVEGNLRSISQSLGIQADRLMTATQVHGATIEFVSNDASRDSLHGREADGLVALAGDLAIAVRTADCIPILIGCFETGAAAAVHAGWRGLVAGVVGNSVDALIRCGTRAGSLIACIGPSISAQCFEVSEEVAAQLERATPGESPVDRTLGERPHINLGQVAAQQLRAKGVSPESIELASPCTYLNSKDFYSFRRDGGASGRQLSAIRPVSSPLARGVECQK